MRKIIFTTSYEYSSAGFYELGLQGKFDVTHYLKVRELVES